MWLTILILFIFSIFFNAGYKVYNDLAWKEPIKKNNFLEHIFNSLSWLFVLLCPIVSYNWYMYLIIYTLLRISFYDYFRLIFNSKARLFSENDPIKDLIIIKLKMPETFFIMIRLMSLIMAIYLSIEYIN